MENVKYAHRKNVIDPLCVLNRTYPLNACIQILEFFVWVLKI